MTTGYILGLTAFVVVFFVGCYALMHFLGGLIADDELSKEIDKMEREADGQ